jgi:hypothetical protein
VIVLVLAAGCVRTSHSNADRRRLDSFLQDPVAAFRAPGTELLSTEEFLGGVDHPVFGGPTSGSSEYVQTMSMVGDAGDTVEAYVQPARDAGWHLLEFNCSRQALRVEAVFVTPPDLLSATFDEATAARKASLTVTALVETHRLRVDFGSSVLGGPPAPSTTGLPRRDVHCLSGFDPADPRRLQGSRVPARTAAQLCALGLADPLRCMLRLPSSSQDAAGSVGPPACILYTADGSPNVAIQDAAQRSRASFEDRQFSPAYMDDGILLIAGPPGRNEELTGALVDTANGPIEVQMEAASLEAVVAFSQALQQAASVPQATPPPAVRRP